MERAAMAEDPDKGSAKRVDPRLLRMVSDMYDVKSITRQRQTVRLNENAVFQLALDDNVAKHRDTLASEHGINCMQLFSEAQVPGLVDLGNTRID